MRGYRPGLWLIATALAASVGLRLAAGIVRQLVETQAVRGPPLKFLAVTSHIDLGLSAVLVAGGILAAVGADGARRRWFALVAVGIGVARLAYLAPWLLSLGSSEVSYGLFQWLLRLGLVAYLGGEAALAMALLRGRGHRQLALGALAVAGARLVAYGLVQVTARGPLDVAPDALRQIEGALALLGSLLSLFVAFDLLGAFPMLDPGEAPSAQIPGPARGVASTVTVVLVVIGVSLAALALWGTKQVSAAEPNRDTLAHGIIVFAVSMSAVWRMRGRPLGVGWLAAGTVALYIAGRLVLALSVEPVQHVKLVEMKVPGMTIGLPGGTVDHLYTYRELGKLSVITRHADLGLVRLWWTTAAADPVNDYVGMNRPEITNVPFREMAGDVSIGGTVWSMSTVTELYASWKCPADSRWFVLELSRYSHGVAVIHEVASRIFRTIHCDAATLEQARPMTLSIAKPAGVDGDFLVRWSATDDYQHADPAALLDLLNYGAYADHVVTLPRVQVVRTKDIVESDDRSMFEVLVEDKRVIVSTWRCFTLDVDVALFHVGPANAPRDPIVEVMRGAHCPH